MERDRDPLMQYLRRPSRSRLERAVKSYHLFLWDVALRICGDPEEAADVCQDVTLKLLLDPPDPGTITSPAGYLAWRAIGRARFLQRSRERRKVREQEFLQLVAGPGIAEGDLEEVRAAVEELPEDLRAAVDLRYLAGLSPGRAAEILGISERALFQRIEKARAILKRRLVSLGTIAALAIEPADAALSPPPASLLPGLLEIVKKGEALAAVQSGPPIAITASIRDGALATRNGTFMAKKIGAGIGIALMGLAVWLVGSRIAERPPQPPKVSAEKPAISTRAPTKDRRPAGAVAEGAKASSDPMAAQIPWASLEGVVVDEDGQPVEGATVILGREIGAGEAESLGKLGFADVPLGRYEREATTEADGAFAVEEVLPCRLYINAQKTLLFGGNAEVELTPAKRGWVELRMENLRRMSGTIRAKDGSQLSGGLVYFHHLVEDPPLSLGKDNHVFGAFPADSAGRYDTGFRLKVSKGSGIEVNAWADGRVTATRQFKEDAFQGLEATIDFDLEQAMSISLIVTDPDGTPIEGAEVGQGGESDIHGWVPYPASFTDSQGRTAIDHLEAKSQSIRVAKEGFHPAGIKVEPGASTNLPVTLAPGTKEPEVELPPEVKLRKPYIAGTVVWGDTGEPVQEAEVDVRFRTAGEELSRGGNSIFLHLGPGRDWQFPPPAGRWLTSSIDAEGRFLVRLPTDAGPLGLTVQARSRSVWWHNPESEKLWWSSPIEAEIEPGSAITDLRIEVRVGAIEGRVAAEDGGMAPGEVVAIYGGGAIVACRTADVEGRFRFSRLPPGRYAIEPLGSAPSIQIGTSSPGWEDGLPDPDQLFDRRIEVAAGRTTKVTLDLAKERLGTVEGTVAADLPPDARICYGILLNGRLLRWKPFGGETQVAAGKLRIEGLLPGRYRVWAAQGLGREERTIASVEVEVARARVARADLLMQGPR